jgi:FemAB-related protein (PEP-CTERM system-associated)
MAASTDSISVVKLDDSDRWDDFVVGRAEANYCHLYGWRRVAELAYRRSCHYLAAMRDDRVTGVLPLVWMPGRLAGRRLVSMPYLDLGGALAADAASRAALESAALERAVSLGASLVELREQGAQEPPRTAPEGGRVRFVLGLPESEEELWSKLGPKVRNQARKAEKSGLSTTRVESARVGEFYAVFARNMRDLGSPVHDRRFFEAVFESLGDAARLFLTTDASGRCVGGAVGIAFRRELSVPWASSLRSERRHCPNHSLYWQILRDAIAAGAERFDFGRSSVGSGTYRFKKQWGAAPLPLAWRLVDDGGERSAGDALSSSGNSRLVSLWKRLPLGIANRLGPRIRGRLPH